MRRFTPWISVGVLLLLVAGAATVSAATAPDRSHHSIVIPGQQSITAVVVPEAATGPPPTTTSVVNQSPSVQTPTTTTSSPPIRQPSTTTTSSAPIPACASPQFTVVLTTDKSTYEAGETVEVTMSVTNEGPTCAGVAEMGFCAANVTATNGSGAEVWSSGSTPVGAAINCPAMIVGSIPAGWHQSEDVTWTQDECTQGFSPGPPPTNPQCPQTQVAAGGYSLVGSWNGADGVGGSQSGPVAITIS